MKNSVAVTSCCCTFGNSRQTFRDWPIRPMVVSGMTEDDPRREVPLSSSPSEGWTVAQEGCASLGDCLMRLALLRTFALSRGVLMFYRYFMNILKPWFPQIIEWRTKNGEFWVPSLQRAIYSASAKRFKPILKKCEE